MNRAGDKINSCGRRQTQPNKQSGQSEETTTNAKLNKTQPKQQATRRSTPTQLPIGLIVQ